MDGEFNYTHARSVNEPEGQNYIPHAPVLTSIGGLSTKFKKGLSSSLRYLYMGDRPANEDNSIVAKGNTVLDAGVSYSLKRF